MKKLVRDPDGLVMEDVMRALEFRESNTLLIVDQEYEHEGRFTWLPEGNEIYDMKMDKYLEPLQFVMEIRQCTEDEAWAWLDGEWLSAFVSI